MKRIIICQSVVRCQCCLGLTDSRPCPPPFFGNILHYHIVFSLISLCVRPKTTPRLRKQVCFPFCSLSQLHNGVRRAVLPPSSFIYWRHKQSTPHHLSSWVLRPMVFIVCGICWSYKVRGRESEVPLSFSIYWRHKQHQQSTVNTTLQSWVLHQSRAFLACVCNIDELSENIPSIVLQQSTLSWYFCVECGTKSEKRGYCKVNKSIFHVDSIL